MVFQFPNFGLPFFQENQATDKTGTLTQDKIILDGHFDIYGQTSQETLNYAYVNSFYQTGLKNQLDVAVLEYGQMSGLESPEDK